MALEPLDLPRSFAIIVTPMNELYLFPEHGMRIQHMVDLAQQVMGRFPEQLPSPDKMKEWEFAYFEEGSRSLGVLRDIVRALSPWQLRIGPLPLNLNQPDLPFHKLSRFTILPDSLARWDREALAMVSAWMQPIAREFRFDSESTIIGGEGQLRVLWPKAANTIEDARLIAAILLQANVDNMNPEIFGYLSETLFEIGARDVHFTPILMKKGRPAIQINVLIDPQDESRMVETIFRETLTLGIRRVNMETWVIPRHRVMVKTAWGKVPVKVGVFEGDVQSVHPEFDVCKEIARIYHIPLRAVMDQVWLKYWTMIEEGQ